MKLTAIRFPLIREGDDIVAILLEAIKKEAVTLEDGDIIAIADKIVAISEGRIAYFKDIKPSKKAENLAKTYNLEPEFIELVLREANKVFGGVPRAILTEKDDIIIANAGIDHKNAPPAAACLWSLNPNKTAEKIRKEIFEKTGKKTGVILVDSHVIPMRMGTIGFALGIAGFKPVEDCRGSLDLYDKPLVITRLNVADDLAAATHLLMGETTERTPVVIIQNSNIKVTDQSNPREVIIQRDECMFMRVFIKKKNSKRQSMRRSN